MDRLLKCALTESLSESFVHNFSLRQQYYYKYNKKVFDLWVIDDYNCYYLAIYRIVYGKFKLKNSVNLFKQLHNSCPSSVY